MSKSKYQSNTEIFQYQFSNPSNSNFLNNQQAKNSFAFQQNNAQLDNSIKIGQPFISQNQNPKMENFLNQVVQNNYQFQFEPNSNYKELPKPEFDFFVDQNINQAQKEKQSCNFNQGFQFSNQQNIMAPKMRTGIGSPNSITNSYNQNLLKLTQQNNQNMKFNKRSYNEYVSVESQKYFNDLNSVKNAQIKLSVLDIDFIRQNFPEFETGDIQAILDDKKQEGASDQQKHGFQIGEQTLDQRIESHFKKQSIIDKFEQKAAQKFFQKQQPIQNCVQKFIPKENCNFVKNQQSRLSKKRTRCSIESEEFPMLTKPTDQQQVIFEERDQIVSNQNQLNNLAQPNQNEVNLTNLNFQANNPVSAEDKFFQSLADNFSQYLHDHDGAKSFIFSLLKDYDSEKFEQQKQHCTNIERRQEIFKRGIQVYDKKHRLLQAKFGQKEEELDQEKKNAIKLQEESKVMCQQNQELREQNLALWRQLMKQETGGQQFFGGPNNFFGGDHIC